MKATDRRSFLQAGLGGLAGLAAVPLLGGLAGCQQVPARPAGGAQDCAAERESLPSR